MNNDNTHKDGISKCCSILSTLRVCFFIINIITCSKIQYDVSRPYFILILQPPPNRTTHSTGLKTHLICMRICSGKHLIFTISLMMARTFLYISHAASMEYLQTANHIPHRVLATYIYVGKRVSRIYIYGLYMRGRKNHARTTRTAQSKGADKVNRIW